jgi:ribosome maturation factor RimP
MTQRGRAGSRPGARRRDEPARRGSDQRGSDQRGSDQRGSDQRGSDQRGSDQRAPEQRLPAAPRVDLAAAKARVRAVIEPVVEAAGYDLEEVGLSRAGRRHVVRVLVDADGGINLDGVAVVSREISAALDAAEENGDEVLPGEYQLEVGSPGVDRPLTLPRHWRRNITRLVAVNGLTGRVVDVDEDGIVLDVDGTPRALRFGELGPGKVQVEFKRMAEADFDDDDDDDEEDDDEGEGEE